MFGGNMEKKYEIVSTTRQYVSPEFNSAPSYRYPAEEGKREFVYHDESRRRFRWVTDNGNEMETGSATEGHLHEGKGTFTFYGKVPVEDSPGLELSLSFHCKPQPVG